MRASGFVGRVGCLAVGSGVGAVAVTGGVATASAAPTDDPTTTADSAADSSAAKRQRGAPQVRGDAGPGAVKTPRRGRTNDKPLPSAATRPAKSAPAKSKSVESAKPEPLGTEAFEPSITSPQPSMAAVPAGSSALPSPQFRIAEPAVVVSVPLPAPQAATPRLLAPASTVGTVQSMPAPFSTSWPGSPAESTVGWAVFAAVRRMARPEPVPPPSATVSTGQTFTPAATRYAPFSTRHRPSRRPRPCRAPPG